MAYLITFALVLISAVFGYFAGDMYFPVSMVTFALLGYTVFAPMYGKAFSKRTMFWLRQAGVFHFSMTTAHYLATDNSWAIIMGFCALVWIVLALVLAADMDGLDDTSAY